MSGAKRPGQDFFTYNEVGSSGMVEEKGVPSENQIIDLQQENRQIYSH